MKWRTQNVVPLRLPTTALIATRNNDKEWYLLGVCYMKRGETQWRDEIDDKPVVAEYLMWLPENEVLATLYEALMSKGRASKPRKPPRAVQ